MICKKCKGTNIKSRRNYSHGKKSRAMTTLTCRDCGSTDIEIKPNNKRWKQRRR